MDEKNVVIKITVNEQKFDNFKEASNYINTLKRRDEILEKHKMIKQKTEEQRLAKEKEQRSNEIETELKSVDGVVKQYENDYGVKVYF